MREEGGQAGPESVSQETGSAILDEEGLAERFKTVLMEWFGSYDGEISLQPLSAAGLARRLVDETKCDKHQPAS